MFGLQIKLKKLMVQEDRNERLLTQWWTKNRLSPLFSLIPIHSLIDTLDFKIPIIISSTIASRTAGPITFPANWVYHKGHFINCLTYSPLASVSHNSFSLPICHTHYWCLMSVCSCSCSFVLFRFVCWENNGLCTRL